MHLLEMSNTECQKGFSWLKKKKHMQLCM
jgi:hypothetical protein